MMQTNSMARTVLDAPTPNAALQVQPSAGRRAGAAWRVEIATDYAAVGDRWERLAEAGAAIGFQRRHWLSAWYETLGREAGVEPTAVDLENRTQLLAGFTGNLNEAAAAFKETRR